MYSKVCEFAKRNNLVPNENKKLSNISGYIVLDSDGNYQGIEVLSKEHIARKLVPDFGAFSRVPKQPNPICEKAQNILLKDSEKSKYECWVETMRTGDGTCESLSILWNFIHRYDTDIDFEEMVLKDFVDSKLKDICMLSFMIDGTPIEDLTDWEDWFYDRLNLFKANKAANKSKKSIDGNDMIISCISGELQESVPYNCCPEIKDIPGDIKTAFGIDGVLYTVAVKENSYQSYGFDGAKCSQMGIDDAKLLATGFEKLLSDPNYHDTNFGVIYLYDENDLDNIIKDSFDLGSIDEEELDDYIDSHKSLLTNILSSVYTGTQPNIIYNDAHYHMAKFNAPSRGRFYLSNECTGTYKELQESLYKWYSDTHIVTYDKFNNKRNYSIFKFYHILCDSIKFNKSKRPEKPSETFKRVQTEFGAVKSDLLNAIYQNKQIPIIFYLRSIDNVIKSKNVGSFVKRIWIQLIKCYLVRKEIGIMPELTNQGSAAYMCGRLFATYEAMQRDYHYADGKRVGKDLSQSYFSAVIKQPSIFFPKLADLGAIYLSKIKWAERYKLLLGELSELIGGSFPTKFDNIQQGEFILGYYQQQAEFIRQKNEAIAAKQESIEKEEE